MPGSNRALTSVGASAVYAISGFGGTSTTTPIDGDDTTQLSLGSINTWNVLVDLGGAWQVDSWRVFATGGAATYWVLLSNTGTSEADFTRVATGDLGDSGLVALPLAVNARYVEVRFFVTAADVLVKTIEAWAGAAPPPATGEGVASNIEEWLSSDSDTNLHHSDLPWRTDANVTTLKGEAEGASGFAAIKGVVDTIATSVGSGLRTAVTTLTTNVATANDALAHAATTWSDALATALQAMSDDFASFGASKAAQGGGITGVGTFPSDVGTLVWTMLDETDFVGSIAWAQPADVYVLSITTRPHGLPLNLTDGVHTIYRCGWWTPLNGSFARQRSYIDFEDNHLAIGAERIPGILVSLQPGGEGHIQAWALT